MSWSFQQWPQDDSCWWHFIIILVEPQNPISSSAACKASVVGCLPALTMKGASCTACRCLNVTDAGYAAVAAGCPGLQVLRMYACSGLKDATLQALGAHARQLQVVDLCGAQLLTDAGLQVIHNGLPALLLGITAHWGHRTLLNLVLLLLR